MIRSTDGSTQSVEQQQNVNWEVVRVRASSFPEEAFAFVREGLEHTVGSVHGVHGPAQDVEGIDRETLHVTGQDLCLGLRDLAIRKYGLLARTVLRKWGVNRTDDFGAMVYAMIDRQELRSSDQDSIDDFRSVYDFEEAFSPAQAGSSLN